ncbi:MAG TPA: haloacid dehalogenase [Clostridiales bacterium]|jgi:HAD superfamily hydrolase (TIGR01450 family)|nr:HAD-IIA family hydrolase [Clostridiales bacterium]HBL82372.1 haloacid dehalogenase [Clostridiales bacterium]
MQNYAKFFRKEISGLKQKKLFLLDMDGTIYLDHQLFDGTLDFLDYVKSIGGRYLFLTNNSSNSADKYVEKLKSLGIASEKEDFLTSVFATALYLKKHYANKKHYVFGTKSFQEELADAGLNVTDTLSDDIDCLVMGYDTELTFQKLEDACILLGRGVPYIAANPDFVCPTWYGYVPDCGSVAQALFNATKRMPKFIGKPEPEMALLALERTGFQKSDTILLGDRLYTDIACGFNAGIDTALMLSGEATMKDYEESSVKPDFIFETIKEFLKFLK